MAVFGNGDCIDIGGCIDSGGCIDIHGCIEMVAVLIMWLY